MLNTINSEKTSLVGLEQSGRMDDGNSRLLFSPSLE